MCVHNLIENGNFYGLLPQKTVFIVIEVRSSRYGCYLLGSVHELISQSALNLAGSTFILLQLKLYNGDFAHLLPIDNNQNVLHRCEINLMEISTLIRPLSVSYAVGQFS